MSKASEPPGHGNTAASRNEHIVSGNKAKKPCGTSSPEERASSYEKINPFYDWPVWAQLSLVLSMFVFIVLLLIGLPVSSLLIVERMSIHSLHGTVSFWGASFAAFISLAVVFIAAVFAFTALKVETGAKREAREQAVKIAREEARKEVEETVGNKAKEYLEKHGERLTRDEAGGYLMKNGHHLIQKSAEAYLKERRGDKEPETGTKITKEAAEAYLRDEDDNGTEKATIITTEAADTHIKNNADKLIKEATDRYLEAKGIEPTKEAARAYIEKHGERIATEVIDLYARRRTGLTGWFRGILKSKDYGEQSAPDTKTGDDPEQRSGDARGTGPDDSDSRS